MARPSKNATNSSATSASDKANRQPSRPTSDRAAEEQAVSLDAASVAAARHRMISERAYSIAERRGFPPGSEVENWLAAEAEVDRSLEQS